MPDARPRPGATRPTILRTPLLAVAALGAALCCAAPAQDLGVFLSPPPPAGAWARYCIETRDPSAPEGTPPKVKHLLLAVTPASPGTVWVEASPMDLAGDDDGTLRLLLADARAPQVDADPLLQAKALHFRPTTGEAYALAPSALGFFQRQLAGVKVVRSRDPLPEEVLPGGAGGPLPCSKERVKTHAEGEFLLQHRTLDEEGLRWFSDQTPFRLVRAELRRTETRDGRPPRVREVVIRLEEASAQGARTSFPQPPARTRGLLSLLFR